MTKHNGVIVLDEWLLENLLHQAGIPRDVKLRAFWTQDYPPQLHLALEHPDMPEREEAAIAQRILPILEKDENGNVRIEVFPIRTEWGS